MVGVGWGGVRRQIVVPRPEVKAEEVREEDATVLVVREKVELKVTQSS
jgi:hypothetical protein